MPLASLNSAQHLQSTATSAAVSRTLADVADFLRKAPELTPEQRRGGLGGLRSLCVVLQCAPQDVPADLAEIERRLRAIPASAVGRSRKTVANVRSRVKSVLQIASCAAKLPPRGVSLHPDWKTLQSALPSLRMRNDLSSLIRYASFRGVAPSAVDDRLLQEMLDATRQSDAGRNTTRLWRSTATTWNNAGHRVSGWPATRLTPPPAAKRTTHLPLAAFAPTFTRDLDAYLAWVSGADAGLPNPPSRVLRPSTVRQRREQLRLAASTLATSLGYARRVQRLASLVDQMNLRTILAAYLKRTPNGVPTAFIRGLATTLLAVAKEWVKVSPEHYEALQRFVRRLGSAPSGLAAKNRDLLRHFEDRARLAALLELPDRLHARLLKQRLSPARRLQRMRTLVTIELLLAAPLRLRDLASLELDHTVLRPDGRAGPIVLVAQGTRGTAAGALRYPLEGRARALLAEYIDRYRAPTRPDERPWLFAHMDGGRVPEAALRDGITKAVRRELGIAMSPHQFRHVAAAVTLGARPDAVDLVRDLLGHRHVKSTMGLYAELRTRAATREYEHILAAVRQPASTSSTT